VRKKLLYTIRFKTTIKKRGFVVRKGQVTIFIILGIFIVVFVALFFVFATLDLEQYDTEKQAAAYALIAQCVEDVAISGIPFLAARGGYYETPPEYLLYTEENNPYFTTIPYYYKSGEVIAASEDALAAQFELFLLSRVRACYNSSSAYSFREMNTEEVSVSFTTYAVEIRYDSGMALVDASTTTTMNPTEITIPSSYYSVYETARAITEEQSKRGNNFCITCLTTYKQGAIENILTEEVSTDDVYAIVYGITFSDESTDANVLFTFAGRYALASEREELLLLPIPDQSIVIGYLYEYQALATKTAVTFSDSSDLFAIDASSGSISFYPDEESVGTHLIEITVTDSDGNVDTTSFYLEIVPVVSPIDISYIGTIAAPIGEQFNYTLSITEKTNQTVYYFDDSSLFDIELTSGALTFTPEEGQEGTHEILFTATTQDGSTAEERMTLVIY
jgi:hypothetical protein